MTLNGAIMQLAEMRENSMMSEVFKPYFDKVIETVSECEEPSTMSERKKGKWIPDNNNYIEERFICSACGRSYKVDTCMGKPMWDFCPCGADMRGEQDDR